MGLRLHHVSRVVLVYVVTLLRDTAAAQASDPFHFLDLPDLPPGCFGSYGQETLARRCLFPETFQFKDNATGPVFTFYTRFSAWVDLGPPITGYGGSARNALEGFTFAMFSHPNASVGGDGGFLGLLNATSDGDPNSHTFAVEFDFVKSPQFSDPDEGFHIGIDINSMNSTSSVLLQGSRYSRSFLLDVWIDYDASSQILNVSADDVSRYCHVPDEDRPELLDESTRIPSTFLSVQVDLSDVLHEYMYVGFTWSVAAPQPGDPDENYEPLKIYTSNQSDIHCTFPYDLDNFEIWLAVILGPLTAMAVIYALLYKCYSRWMERRGWRFKIDPDDLGDADPHKFTYKELAMATKNFDSKQVLGRGGFGSVYKGFLPGNKQYVAVKRVAPESNQGEREFLAEVMIIGKIRHRNLVRLQGWCHERGELLLVYDYMPQGSLDKHLFGSPFSPMANLSCDRDQEGVNKLVVVDEEVVVKFPWERRFKVVVDVATALVYLHTECEERIIHRDVKAANVMLDAKFNARLGDFGLARSYNHSLLTPESTNVAGTFGYFAPELFHTGKQTEETDVYSFGAFMLEVACGKKPIYHEEGKMMLLLDQVWHMWRDSCIVDAADECLAGIFNVHEMTNVLCLGLLCSHPSPTMRPSMRQVLLILNGDVPLPEVPLSKPQFDYMPRSAPEDLSWTSNASSMYHTALEIS